MAAQTIKADQARRIIGRIREGIETGIVGQEELVNGLLEDKRYGRDDEAAELAHRVVAVMADLVERREVPHCRNGRATLHAQSGIGEDIDVTAGEGSGIECAVFCNLAPYPDIQVLKHPPSSIPRDPPMSNEAADRTPVNAVSGHFLDTNTDLEAYRSALPHLSRHPPCGQLY